MSKLLTLQKNKAEAAVAVETAQAKVTAAKTDAERSAAMGELGAALATKIAANEALMAASSGEPASKVTHYHEKHEKERTVETDDEEEDAAMPPKKDEEGDDEKSTTGSGSDAAAEKDEESKAIVAAYVSASGPVGKISATASLYAPDRLLRAVKEATGAKTIKEAFGALSNMGPKLAAARTLEKKVEALEAKATTTEIDAQITLAKKAGKVGGKTHESSLRADGQKHGSEWLKGHLAAAPVVLRTEPLKPRTDADGNAVGEITPDMEKILASVTAGKTPAEAAVMRAAILAEHTKKMNGAASRPSH